MLKEKSVRIKIDGKEYILKFRKELFDNSKYVVELLKEQGQYEFTVAYMVVIYKILKKTKPSKKE